MNFLVYGRAFVEASDHDTPALDEAHWSYMEAFADRMTARGPTLSPDRTTWTGSLHVVDLDDANAARAFAVDDPYHRAGLFRDHLIRRFDNLLGRTMWDVTVQAEHVPFLIIAGSGEVPSAPMSMTHLPQAVAERLVLWGALHPVRDDIRLPSGHSIGMALALLVPHEAAARTLIAAEPALLGGHTDWEIHAWEFGGRP
jgi:uncharacterized protein YciI